MAINSKAKGKRGELAWCRFCGEFGYTVRRTAQFCGNNEAGAPDCIGIRGIHQEVKFVEHLNIQDAMDQSIRDARKAMKNEVPIVAHSPLLEAGERTCAGIRSNSRAKRTNSKAR